jgi:diacylglycerol kinase (ATP)
LSQPERVAVIVNAAAGHRASRARTARRMALARDVLTAARVPFEVFATEYGGHARDLTRRAIDTGVRTVVAWGGDGTVNEIGSILAFTDTALAIVPGGSGNGLAYELGVPHQPRDALRRAVSSGERRIDAGEIGGRLFFNLAGFGFDAHVADLFARGTSRGLRGYVAIAVRELFAFRPLRLQVAAGGTTFERELLLFVVANGTQWGRGARIAPQAVLDDGLFDLVAVAPRSAVQTALKIPRLFRGRLAGTAGVSMARASELSVSGPAPLLFHVDGEPGRSASGEVTLRVHPRALRVRV